MNTCHIPHEGERVRLAIFHHDRAGNDWREGSEGEINVVGDHFISVRMDEPCLGGSETVLAIDASAPKYQPFAVVEMFNQYFECENPGA